MNLEQLINSLETLKSKYNELPTKVILNTNDYRELCQHAGVQVIEYKNTMKFGTISLFGLQVIIDDDVTTPQFKGQQK